MPEGEELAAFAKTGATLAIHLSINNLANVVRTLMPVLGEDCPCAVVWRASWPDERVLEATLGTIRERVKAEGFTRTALILVGRALARDAGTDSRLYDPVHSHVLRPAQKTNKKD
jgi:precorrin-4/cobalt-precorrin-4 C11-methyltransferase